MGGIWANFFNVGLVFACFFGCCRQGDSNLLKLLWAKLTHEVLHVLCFRLGVGRWA